MFHIRKVTKTSKYLKDYFLHTRVIKEHRPAFDDVQCFLACDPTSMYVGELDGKPIGAIAVFKYENGYRHAGGFYIEEKYRSYGYGLKLSQEAFQKAEPIANFSFYSKLEVVEKNKIYYHCPEILYTAEAYAINSMAALKNLQGISKDSSCCIKEISDVDFEVLFEYDKCTFGYERKQFLYKWLYSPASHSFVALDHEGRVIGYIVARKSIASDQGYMVGPLFCEDINIGKDLIKSVLQQINKQNTCSVVSVCFPINRDPQVWELLNILNGYHLFSVVLMARNIHRKGRLDKWFSPSSYICA